MSSSYQIRVTGTCLADNNTFGTSRPELSYLSLLVGREPRCHLDWLADDTKGINITGAIWQSVVQISDADTSETVMLPRLGITGDANLPHDFLSLREIEASSGIQLSQHHWSGLNPGITSAWTEVRRLNQLSYRALDRR